MSNKTNLLTLPIHCVVSNDGQIEGLPKNPRLIRDDKFESLKRSIEEDPEMLSLRPVMVYPYNGEYIAIGGNMRLSAMKELGYTDVPCVLIPKDTPVDKLRTYVLKDNYGYGEWNQELLHDEWLEDLEELDMSDVAMFDLNDELMEDEVSDIKKGEEIDIDGFDEKIVLKLSFSIDEYKYVRDRLAKVDANIETAILKVLGYGEE